MRGENLFQISCVDRILVSLVKKFEAFTCFVLTALITPSPCDNVLHCLVVDTLFLQEALIDFICEIFNFFSRKSSETEVVQQSFEMRHGNPTISVLVVKVEGILEISLNITWKLILLEFAFVGDVYEISSGSISSWLTCGLHFLIYFENLIIIMHSFI